MPPETRLPERRRWISVFQRAPIGVLVLGFLLLFLGSAFIVGGAFYALSGNSRHWIPWLVMLLTGPLAIYLALNFLYLKRWSWLTVVVLLGMITLSALARSLGAEETPVAPLAEALVAGSAIAYLFRPRVRQAFG